MVKQVVIQLQDFTSDVCDAPLPAEEQTSFGIKTVKQVRNGLKIEDKQLTNEMARQAFLQYVSRNSCCCLTKSYEKNLQILQIEYAFVFVLTLESFVERRQTCYNFKPDSETDEIIESDEEIPPVWQIKTDYCVIPFVDNNETKVVPNSNVIKNCNKCNGKSVRTCPSCLGIQHSDKICKQCDNSSKIKCEVCTNGKLNWFQLLKVSWKNHKDTRYISKQSLIPESKLKLVEGNLVYAESGQRVSPINFVDKETSQASQVTQECGRLVGLHGDNYNAAKLIEQRLEIRAITTALVHYQYGKKKPGKFCLFYDRVEDLKLHATDYSKNCCTIL